MAACHRVAVPRGSRCAHGAEAAAAAEARREPRVRSGVRQPPELAHLRATAAHVPDTARPTPSAAGRGHDRRAVRDVGRVGCALRDVYTTGSDQIVLALPRWRAQVLPVISPS